MPYIINNVLHLSAKSFGIIEAMFPLGIIAGALFVKKVMNRVHHISLMRFAGIMLAVCTLLMGLPIFLVLNFSENIYLGYYIAVMVIFGVTMSFGDIPIIYRLQVSVPEEYRGRVISTGISIGKIVQPAAYIISGLVLGAVNPALLVAAGGIAMLLSTVVILRRKE